MTNKEVYEFGKVIIATIKNNQNSEVVTESSFRSLRSMTRKMFKSGIITKTQRDWINGQILKMFGMCESNHYILGKRAYK